MNFYVGQQVVYITGNNMPKGSIHTILGISRLPCKCKELVIFIERKSKDFTAITELTTHINCTDCNTIYPVSKHLVGHWMSSSFRPLSERTAESEAFAENLITQLETEVETLEWLHK